jgi:hypothetical protein
LVQATFILAGTPFEMTGSARRNTLILLGLVMIITGIIAASLPRLELQPGMPLPRLVDNQVVSLPTAAQPLMAISVSKFFGIFFTIILLGSFLFMLYRLFRGAKWADIASVLKLVVVVSLIAGIFLLVLLVLPNSGNNSNLTELPVPTPVPVVTAPLGPVPAALLWLAGIGLLVIIILLAVWILTAASRRARPIDQVGSEAEKAWQALKTGLDLREVIIQCYRRMSLALEQERGIERKDFMTTGEFENLLESAGIPHEPIHQLTRLFEAVRYGNWQPNPADEQSAIQCLEAIIAYSHAVRGAD